MFKLRSKKKMILDDKEAKFVYDFNGENVELFNVDIQPSRRNKEMLSNYTRYISQNSRDDKSLVYDGIGFVKRLDDCYQSIKNSTDPETKRLVDFQGVISKNGFEPEKIRNLISVAYRSLNKVKNDANAGEGRELVFSNDEYEIEKLTTPGGMIGFGNGDCWVCTCGVNIHTGEPLPDQVGSAKSAMNGNNYLGYDRNNSSDIKGDYYGFRNKKSGKKYILVYKEGYPDYYKVWSQRDSCLFQKNGEDTKINMTNDYAPQAEEFLEGLKNIDHLGSIKINFKELYDVAMDKSKKEQLMNNASLSKYGAAELAVAETPEQKAAREREEKLRDIQLIENEFNGTIKFSIIGDVVSLHINITSSYERKAQLTQIFPFGENEFSIDNEVNIGTFTDFLKKLKEFNELKNNGGLDKITDPDDETIIHEEIPFNIDKITYIIHFPSLLQYVDTTDISEEELKGISRRETSGEETDAKKIYEIFNALINSPRLLRLKESFTFLSKELNKIGILKEYKESEFFDTENHQKIADSLNVLIDKKIKDVFEKGSQKYFNFSRTVKSLNSIFGSRLGFKIPVIKENNIKYDVLIKEKNVIKNRVGYIDTMTLVIYSQKKRNDEKLEASDIDNIVRDALEKYPQNTYFENKLITPEETDIINTTIKEQVEEDNPNLYKQENEELVKSNYYIPLENVNENTLASEIEWVKDDYIDLRAIINVLIKNNIKTCKEALDYFDQVGIDNIKVGKKQIALNSKAKEGLKETLDTLNKKFSNTEQETPVEEEVIEEQETPVEENETITREEILNETQGREFEFDNGEVYGVDFDEEEQILYAGSISNAGVSRDVEIDYNYDKSIGGNLEALYQKCIEANPELLNENEEYDIQEEEEEPEIEYTEEELNEANQEENTFSNSPRVETHDGGIVSVNDENQIIVTYPATENEDEYVSVIIDFVDYPTRDNGTITSETYNELVNDLLREADLTDEEAQNFISEYLAYTGFTISDEDSEDEE